jgi:hypothetical protein
MSLRCAKVADCDPAELANGRSAIVGDHFIEAESSETQKS